MSIRAINARNQFRGRIREIVVGDVVSEVEIKTSSGIVSAVVTKRSIKDLGLHPGSDVIALFKATDVAIARLG
jgi:molybdopterin-binding protein